MELPMPRGGSVAGRVAVATTPVGCRGGLLPLGRASLTAAVPSPRGILTQKFGSLYWMEKGSVYPRREPATDGGSAAALPVSGGGGSLWGERGRKGG